jgi:hypothetical protein
MRGGFSECMLLTFKKTQGLKPGSPTSFYGTTEVVP